MYCVHLTSAVHSSQVGAKAANLNKAMSLGLRVPPFFVVTRDALAFFLGKTDLRKQVCEFLEKGSQLDRMARQGLLEELCSAVLATPIPEVLDEEVSALAKQLLESAPVGLAVGSSAAEEDSEKASFAGIFESFLSVSSVKGVWDSILKCWCSSWSLRAIDYARKMRVDLEPDQMAVIV